MSLKVLDKLQNNEKFVKFRGWQGLLATEENGAHTLVFRFDPFYFRVYNLLINQYQPLMVHTISYDPDWVPEITEINEDVHEYANWLWRGGIPAVELRSMVYGSFGLTAKKTSYYKNGMISDKRNPFWGDVFKTQKLYRGNLAAEPWDGPPPEEWDDSVLHSELAKFKAING